MKISAHNGISTCRCINPWRQNLNYCRNTASARQEHRVLKFFSNITTKSFRIEGYKWKFQVWSIVQRSCFKRDLYPLCNTCSKAVCGSQKLFIHCTETKSPFHDTHTISVKWFVVTSNPDPCHTRILCVNFLVVSTKWIKAPTDVTLNSHFGFKGLCKWSFTCTSGQKNDVKWCTVSWI